MGYAGTYESKLGEAGIINNGKYNPDELEVLLKEFDLGMVCRFGMITDHKLLWNY